MKTLALAAALLLGGAARAQAQAEDLPPPPPPPSVEEATPAKAPPPPAYSKPIQAEMQQAPPPPGAAPATAPAAAPAQPRGKSAPGTIGEGPVAPAGSPAAPLHPDESVSHWRFSLASGVAGRWGGMQLSSTEANSHVMIFFGGQADGLWSKGIGRSFRLRLRMFTGGEDILFVPSDGDVEAAFMLGRRELRFVVGRIEAARFPGLGLDVLLQAATLPCFEGSISFASDRMRFYYYISPVAAAYVWYHGDAHVDDAPGWPSETSSPSAASAFRARYTVMVPPSVLLSVQGDYMKMWDKPDALFSVEGSAGAAVLDGSVVLNALVRFDRYRRRGTVAHTEDTSEEVKLLAVATLAF
jgi:hypothetical protein